MTRYTVVYTRESFAAMTRLWLTSFDRSAIARAGDAIDRELRDDALHKGCAVGSTLRQLIVAPLVVEFTVEKEDRKVTIWSVRHVGHLSNGH